MAGEAGKARGRGFSFNLICDAWRLVYHNLDIDHIPRSLVLRYEGWSPEGEATPSALKRVGIYGTEFVPGAIGEGLSALPTFTIWITCQFFSLLYNLLSGEELLDFNILTVPLAVVHIVNSSYLTAARTHLGGKIWRQEGNFKGALVGAALGNVIGTAGTLAIYQGKDTSPALGIGIGIWVALPPIMSVVFYNMGDSANEW